MDSSDSSHGEVKKSEHWLPRLLRDREAMLVIGTWCLVVVSIVTTILTTNRMSDQLKLSREALILEWRPYLFMEFAQFRGGALYSLGDSIGVDTIFRDLSDVELTSDSYMAVKRVRLILEIKRALKNGGRSPLRVLKSSTSTLTQLEWVNKYKKDVDRLIADIRHMKEFVPNDVDVFLSTGDSTESDFRGFQRNLIRKEFDSLRVKSTQLVLYPYSLVEYEDIRGNKFSTFLMKYVTYSIAEEKGFVKLEASGTGTEKYVFDAR